jgi:hypothetical protein
MSETVKAAVPAVCPGCGKTFRAPAGLVGKTVKCKCGRSWKLEAAVGDGGATERVGADATRPAGGETARGNTTRADSTAADRTRPDPARKPAAARAGKAVRPAGPLGDAELEPGTQVGNFEIVRVLGRGSMGAVYEARDRVLNRRTALKLVPKALPADQLPEFLRRANLTNVLLHPNIAAIFQIARHEDRCLLVEELGESGSACDFVQERGRMLPADAVRVAACAARGLAAAHGRGVVHRNVHPNNILLGEGWTVRIADFGVTDALAAMGILPSEAVPADFACPEFCMGQPTDARSDVYSAGAVLYYLLTGKPPYAGRTRAAVMAGHTDGAVPDPRAVAEDVPDAAAGIVQKAMAKGPAQRYATAAELAADLEAAHAEIAPNSQAAPIAVEAGTGKPGEAPATAARSAPLPVRKPAWMHPVYLGGAAAALLLLVGAVLLFRGGSTEPESKNVREREVGNELLKRIAPTEGIGAAAARKLLGGASDDHRKSIDAALNDAGGGPRKLVPNLNPGINICPVCGELAQVGGREIDHKGRKVVLCSDRCVQTFKLNPARYEAKLGG